MKPSLLTLWLITAGIAATAQTTAPAPGAPAREPSVITSDTADFDLSTRQVTYRGHVFLTDPEVTMRCELLTISFPHDDGSTNQVRRPNHIQADTNVVIDFTDPNGEKYHVTAEQTVYAFSVINAVTNETVTFIGNPRVETAKAIITSEPMVWDRTTKHFKFTNPHMTSLQNLADFGSTNGAKAKPF